MSPQFGRSFVFAFLTKYRFTTLRGGYRSRPAFEGIRKCPAPADTVCASSVLWENERRVPVPVFSPMPLASLPEPFDHDDWLYELKFDGFRALAYIENGTTRLVSEGFGRVLKN